MGLKNLQFKRQKSYENFWDKILNFQIFKIVYKSKVVHDSVKCYK